MKKYKREALEQKYRAHPFLGIEAGKNVVLSEINKFLDIAENGRYTHPLYTDEEINAVISTISTAPEHAAYKRYVCLRQWIKKARSLTRSELETANALLFYALEMFSNIHRMERVEATIRASASSEEIYSSENFTFRTTDLLRFTYVETDELNLINTWNTVEIYLKVAQAYNKAIELIAKEINIPEFKCFRIDYNSTLKLIKVLTEQLLSLKEFIETRSGYEGVERELRINALSSFEKMYNTSEASFSATAIKAATKDIKGLASFSNSEPALMKILFADLEHTEDNDDSNV